ncbi:SigE family RNA polymerase sigma factor [Streptomyces sp. ISL-96]|uniref:SigE family RNA polymerase sigma factor n=1 Tax=Streptomyces sp. ISL-96 TaxID=2819191 RepID=UPI001BE5EA8A|nr:SigE family RNA polymerase sigma factor [Streptomyces sp. ISL-96]MBT2492998.1 SigE family RNA polymerase sigma factor [Streptomyces sp. ISL-96]
MRNGRDEAFSAFMAARYGSLVRTATLLTGGGRTRAEDLAQEALLRTYRAWNRIGRLEAAEAYTRTTMVRLLVKDRRRQWSAEIPAEHVPETLRPGHEDQVTTAVAVRELLRTVPPAQRAVLVLRFYHQLTEREIADVLGCSPGTVKSRAARALSTLRDQGFLSASVLDRERGSADD